MVKFSFFSGPRSLQYKAERLGWSSSLLLQTEAVLIGDYGREQTDCRYVLYMTPLQKTRTIPLKETYNAHFQVDLYILGYYLTRFTCFKAQKTPSHSSHTVQCCSSVFTLVLKSSVLLYSCQFKPHPLNTQSAMISQLTQA